MYPAQALIDGLYTVDDLPDEVLFNDGSRPPTILQKTLDPELVGGVGYPWPEDGSDDAGIYFIVINDGSDPITWAFGDDRGEGSFPCLIQGDGNLTPNNNLSEDQFADTYTITYNSDITCESVSSTVTRESLCVWRGIADDGSTITLEIEFGSFSNLYAWTTNAPNCGGNKRGIGMPFDRYNNLGRLNTPLGNYEDEITPGSIIHTVS